MPVLQVTISPPRHIYYSLLLPATDLQINTSSKPSESCQYYRSPCHHLTIYLILHYYLLQVYRSTRRRNLHVYTLPQFTMSHLAIYLILYYYRSTGQHVVKTSIIILYYRSPSPHIAMYLILYYYLLQVYRSTRRRNLHVYTLPQFTMSHLAIYLILYYYRSTGQHVVKTSIIILYYRSPSPHIAMYLILYYYLLHVYRSTRRQNPQIHSNTTGHYVTTSP